jgi:hypothetical protein
MQNPETIVAAQPTWEPSTEDGEEWFSFDQLQGQLGDWEKYSNRELYLAVNPEVFGSVCIFLRSLSLIKFEDLSEPTDTTEKLLCINLNAEDLHLLSRLSPNHVRFQPTELFKPLPKSQLDELKIKMILFSELNTAQQ